MANITGMHHISLKPRPEEFEKTLIFYRDVLGLKQQMLWDTGAMLSCGGVCVELLAKPDGGRGDGVWDHLAFATQDVGGMLEKVRDAGYEITVPQQDVLLAGVKPITIGFCRGPLGEHIEFFRE